MNGLSLFSWLVPHGSDLDCKALELTVGCRTWIGGLPSSPLPLEESGSRTGSSPSGLGVRQAEDLAEKGDQRASHHGRGGRGLEGGRSQASGLQSLSRDPWWAPGQSGGGEGRMRVLQHPRCLTAVYTAAPGQIQSPEAAAGEGRAP